MTAAERRAAGEAEFCNCPGHVGLAYDDLRYGIAHVGPTSERLDYAAALLRALVVQALLDPATWARPKGWWRS